MDIDLSSFHPLQNVTITNDGNNIMFQKLMQSPTLPFRSWLSLTSLMILMFLFRSMAAPFLNPKGAPRKEFSSSTFYWNICAFLYCWILLVTTLTVLPHFSSHYNEIIAMAMFFPMTFATVCAVLFGRLMVRIGYYGYQKWNVAKPVVKRGLTIVKSLTQLPTASDDKSHPQKKDQDEEHFEEATTTMPKLIAFHRPFRRLLRSSIILSVCLSFLYAHCWNKPLKGFELNGPICNAFFFWSSYSNEKSRIVSEENLWFVWIVAVILTLMSYTEEEFAGLHFRQRNSQSMIHEGFHHDDVDDDMDDLGGLHEPNHEDVSAMLSPSKIKFFNKQDREQPKDTLPMVCHYLRLFFDTFLT